MSLANPNNQDKALSEIVELIYSFQIGIDLQKT